MNNKRFNSLTKKLLVGLIAACILLSFNACTKKIAFLTSSVVPAARGYVKVDRDDNENYVIHINITDLAEVKRLEPENQTYVVWIDTDEETSKNIGQLNSSSGTFSNKLKASFEAISTARPKKVYITAEKDANVQYPGREIVLSTSQF